MKGHNTLILNNETVLAALQEYVDKRWKPDGDSLLEVRQVAIAQNHRDHTVTPDFRVEVCEVTPQERAQRAASALLGHDHAASETGQRLTYQIEHTLAPSESQRTVALLRAAQEIADRRDLLWGTALIDPALCLRPPSPEARTRAIVEPKP